MSVLDPQLLQKMQEYRRKAADGTISLEEMREAIVLMRQGRVAAVATAASSKSRAAKPTVSAEALLSELEGL